MGEKTAGQAEVTGPHISQAKFKEFIMEFFRAQHGPDKVSRVSDETNLFDAGMLDSLQLIEFIVALEKFTGTEIAVEEMSVRSFRTMTSIWEKVVMPMLNGTPA
jgi:acyl carrier protein